jgi:ubiquinone/menaquinone biosynthesis C-methylase UbiE
MDKHAPEDQYNPDIAASYSLSKQLPFRLFVEQPTIFHLLGDLAGRSVLDLGCGDGIWTREIIRGGAARAVGVDLSPAMITRAKEATSGASFEVGDAATLGRLSSAPFDLVLGSYLLNYADTREKLLGMLETARANLKGGGKFVGFNDDPRDSVGAIHRVSLTERYPTYGKYGITK